MLQPEEAKEVEPDLSTNLSVIVGAYDGDQLVGYLPVVMTPFLSNPVVSRDHLGKDLVEQAGKIFHELGFSHMMALTADPIVQRGLTILGFFPTNEAVLEKELGEGSSYLEKAV